MQCCHPCCSAGEQITGAHMGAPVPPPDMRSSHRMLGWWRQHCLPTEDLKSSISLSGNFNLAARLLLGKGAPDPRSGSVGRQAVCGSPTSVEQEAESQLRVGNKCSSACRGLPASGALVCPGYCLDNRPVVPRDPGDEHRGAVQTLIPTKSDCF